MAMAQFAAKPDLADSFSVRRSTTTNLAYPSPSRIAPRQRVSPCRVSFDSLPNRLGEPRPRSDVDGFFGTRVYCCCDTAGWLALESSWLSCEETWLSCLLTSRVFPARLNNR